MAEDATIARPYAHALFDVAQSAGGTQSGDNLDRWTNMLAFAAAAVTADGVQAALARPNATAEEKARTLINICGDALDDHGRNLVRLLAQNKRLTLLPEIAEQFEVLRAQAQMTLDVEVISAYPLGATSEAQLTSALNKRFSREINMTSRIDASLVGGAVIRAGDTVIDGSVRGRLDKLREALTRP